MVWTPNSCTHPLGMATVFYFSFFWLCWVFVEASGLWAFTSCGAPASHCGAGAFLVAEYGLSGCLKGFSTCPVACEILVYQPGIELMSFALEDWVLTTGPPGKTRQVFSFPAFPSQDSPFCQQFLLLQVMARTLTSSHWEGNPSVVAAISLRTLWLWASPFFLWTSIFWTGVCSFSKYKICWGPASCVPSCVTGAGHIAVSENSLALF